MGAEVRALPAIQLIDLDAAKNNGDNRALVAVRSAAGSCRVGGGIRSVDGAAACSTGGAQGDHRIVALRAGEPDLEFAESLAVRLSAERLIAAVDARQGHVVMTAGAPAWGLRLGRDSGPGAVLRRLSFSRTSTSRG